MMSETSVNETERGISQMSSRSRYIVLETLISCAINTALSIGFVFLIFHGRSRLFALGPHGIVADMAPQTFMVALMSCLVPSLITRSRIAAGSLLWMLPQGEVRLLRVWLTAGILALSVTCVIVALAWITLPRLIPSGIRFSSLLIWKAAFGMILAAIVTPWAVGRALR